MQIGILKRLNAIDAIKVKTLSEAIQEAQRWDEELESLAIVTKEDDGSYTLYGAGKKVYDTTKNK